MFDEAQRRFRLSFEVGHGCRACGDYIEVDQSRPEPQRRRDAERLRRRHYRNLALRSAAKRSAQ